MQTYLFLQESENDVLLRTMTTLNVDEESMWRENNVIPLNSFKVKKDGQEKLIHLLLIPEFINPMKVVNLLNDYITSFECFEIVQILNDEEFGYRFTGYKKNQKSILDDDWIKHLIKSSKEKGNKETQKPKYFLIYPTALNGDGLMTPEIITGSRTMEELKNCKAYALWIGLDEKGNYFYANDGAELEKQLNSDSKFIYINYVNDNVKNLLNPRAVTLYFIFRYIFGKLNLQMFRGIFGDMQFGEYGKLLDMFATTPPASAEQMFNYVKSLNLPIGDKYNEQL